MTKKEILNRIKEHYEYLKVICGYDVVCTILQGSQNYGLDEYSEDYWSDIDTKSIILPNLEDIVLNKAPISTVEILDNEEHAEVKDIRIMFEMFKKMNISYIELLYSDYIVFNPKYEDIIKEIFIQREFLANINKNQFLRCICGMAYEKQKALCHPYPGMIQKIQDYGYDGKQLSHTIRLYEFITRFVNNEPISACFKTLYPQTLMNIKKQLDEEGLPLSKDRAIELMDYYVSAIKTVKDNNLTEKDEINEYGINLLNRIKYDLIKRKLKEEILQDEEEI